MAGEQVALIRPAIPFSSLTAQHKRAAASLRAKPPLYDNVPMPAYMIVDIDIHDQPAYVAEYAKFVPAIVARHGGKYLARGGKTEVMEGEWIPKRIALFEFPNVDAAKAFLSDPEYQPLKAVRHRVAKTNAITVEGV